MSVLIILVTLLAPACQISKFLLRGPSPIDGLFQLNRHINFFRSLRILNGERPIGAYDFWAWVAQQYRIFADLVDATLTMGVVLPPPDVHAMPSAEKNYLVCDIPLSLIFGKIPDPVRGAVCFCLLSNPHY